MTDLSSIGLEEDKEVSTWLQFLFFTILLAGAGYFFGTIGKQINQSCQLILSPSIELLYLLLWLLAAIGAIVVAAGLVAALLRPLGIGILAFLLSGLAILLGWQVSLDTGVLTLVYVLAASFYANSVAKELNERIRFSVRPISEGRSMLMMALILVTCGGLYLGCSAHIEREGFEIPETYFNMFMEPMKEQILAQIPEEERLQAGAKFEEQFQGMMENFFEETIKPYEQYIPLVITLGLFFPLQTITSLVSWLLPVVLSIIFSLLEALKVTRVVSETKEVQRLVVD